MFKKTRMILITLSLLVTFLVPILAVSHVSAVDVLNSPCSNGAGASSICHSTGASGTPADNAIIGSNGVITRVIKILSIVIGVLAIIMIIVSGFKIMFSGGDSSAVAGARSTLIYALVGLAVAALGTVIVEFVLSKL